MNTIKYIALVFLLVIISGCGVSKPKPKQLGKEQKIKKETVTKIIESKKYKTCLKECEKHPKKISLFKDGFHQPIKVEPIYDLTKKSFLMIGGGQGSRKSIPYMSMFFKEKDWVNKIFFISSKAVNEFLSSLKEVKKDFPNIPNNSEKRYKAYHNSAQGFIATTLYHKDGIKRVFIYVLGRHSVHKVSMVLDEEGLNKIINSINEVKGKVENKYIPCLNSCDETLGINENLSENEKWSRKIDRERAILY